MSDDCRQAIPDVTILVRGIREEDINKQTRKIKKSAFLPRRNGKDDNGLSVSQPLADTIVELSNRMPTPGGHYCTLTAGQVRAISVSTFTLEVCPDSNDRDPYHALIKNIPTDLENTAISTRLAQLLAEASVEYIPLKGEQR